MIIAKKQTGRVRSIVIVVFAIVAISGAGLYVVKNLREERARLRPVEEPAGAAKNDDSVTLAAPEGTDPLEVRSALAFRPGGEVGQSVVELGPAASAATSAEVARGRQGLLERELVRQGILLAARDELGATTRDTVLGEAVSNDPRSHVGYVSSLIPRGEDATLFVRSGEGAAHETVYQGNLGAIAARDEAAPDALALLVQQVEALSRQDLPATLGKLGLSKGKAITWGEFDGPAALEDRLSTLSFPEVFGVIREVHASIRKQGESAARLAALARAYAMLGVLSEFHYRPAHKAYKARALLYAQRLVAKQATRPLAFWTRAYVWALVGRPQETIADLERAGKRLESEPGTASPAWVPVIAAAAHGDLDALSLAPPECANLASLFRLTLCEYPASPYLTNSAVNEVVKRAPECYRAIDAGCNAPALGEIRAMSTFGPQVLAQTLATRLRGLAAIPAEIAAALDAPSSDSVAIVSALEAAAAKDDAELSWSALASLIRETSFVQITRWIYLNKFMLSVPIDDQWPVMQRFVADHPYKPLLESYLLPPAQGDAARDRLRAAVSRPDLESAQHNLLEILKRDSFSDSRSPLHMISLHLDHDTHDLGLFLRDAAWSRMSTLVSAARVLTALDPQTGIGRAFLVQNDYDRVHDQAELWAKEQKLPAVLAVALAGRYQASKDETRAIDLLEHAANLVPDVDTVEKLANIYKSKGQMDRWRRVLDNFLTQAPPTGLDHAKVQVDLANYLMSQKKWDEAWPYAQDAAESWAGWAITCAQECAEGRNDLDSAEKYAQGLSQRYPDQAWAQWYHFCKTYGRGDVESAYALGKEAIAELERKSTPAPARERAYFHWLGGEYKTASIEFEAAYSLEKKGEDLFLAVLTADAGGDTARRDRLFADFETKFGATTPKTVKIWNIIRAASDQIKQGKFDYKPVDELVESTSAENRWYTQYLVGQMIRNLGRSKDAMKYYKAVQARGVKGWIKALVNDSARLGAGDSKTAFAL